MAVGYYETATTLETSELLAEYGSPPMLAAWTLANPTVNIPGASNSLLGVSCTSSTSCMAVGDSDLNSQQRNLSFAWNGSAWTRHSVPEPGSAVDLLDAVRCHAADGKIPAGCVAVGAESSDPSTSQETAIFGWNGSKWTKQTSPSVQPIQILDGLSCPTLKSCVAVGDESDARNQVALADSLIGTSWIHDSVKDPVVLTQFLYGTSCFTSSFCMAVGEFDNGTDDPSLAQIWNGAKWAAASPQQVGRQSSLYGVSCVSKSFCAAAGDAQLGPDLLVSPSAPAGPSPRTPGQRLAKGGESAIPLTGVLGLVEVWRGRQVESYDGGRRFRLGRVPELGLLLLEEILHGSREHRVRGPTRILRVEREDLGRGVHALAFERGRVREARCRASRRPTAWRSAGPPMPEWPSPSTGTANVGPSRTSRRAAEPFDTLNGVNCPSAKRCIAVGGDWSNENDTIPQLNLAESWNGSKWSVMTVPTSIYSVGGLATVSCNSNVSCLAAGPSDTQLSKGGIVLRLANHHWTSVSLPAAASAEVDLQGVSETSGNSAVVVGYIRDLYGFSTFRLVESKGHWAVK